jgi:hypothetical protein
MGFLTVGQHSICCSIKNALKYEISVWKSAQLFFQMKTSEFDVANLMFIKTNTLQKLIAVS